MVIIGEDEVAQGVVTFKDLAAEVETKLPRAQLVAHLQAMGAVGAKGALGGATATASGTTTTTKGSAQGAASTTNITNASIACRPTEKFSVLSTIG